MKLKKRRIYVGTDVGKKRHVADVVEYKQGRKQRLIEAIPFSNSHHGLNKLLKAIEEVTDYQQVLFGMEGTGHYWMNLYYHLTEKGKDVALVNPYDVKLERKRHWRRTKTDAIDATLVTKIMIEDELKPHNDMGIDMGLRGYARYRDFLMKEIGRRRNKLHKIMDIMFPELPDLFKGRVTRTLLAILETCPTPEKVLNLGEGELTKLIRKASRGRKGRGLARAVVEKAKTSFGIPDEGWISPCLLELEHLLEQMKILEKQLKEVEIYMSKFGGKGMEFLESIPGYGRVTSAVYISEVGDVNRFPTKKHLTSYVGLNSSVYETGEFKAEKNPITKAGNAVLRRALLRIVPQAIKANPELQRYVERKKKQGKHKRVIACAVANKLLHYGYVVLKEQRLFRV